MVGKSKETVPYDEKTAAFIEAVKWVKKKERKTLKAIVESFGMEDTTRNMIQAGRRMAHDSEIQDFVKKYPEVLNHYPILGNNPSLSQTLNEPMEPYHNGGSATLRALVATQKKLIAKLEEENVVLKERLTKLEGENEALKEIITKRK